MRLMLPLASPAVSRVPVTIFSGFLGAGKTTLLRHLISQAAHAGPDGRPARWAAVVNDLATLNVDAALLGAEGGAEVVPLEGGCVCCSGADDLGETLARLARSGLYDHLWVETSGVAEPRGVAALFTRKNPFGATLSDHAQLSALVTVVDVVALAAAEAEAARSARALVASPPRPLFELMVEQIECADLVILNQCDRATGAAAQAPETAAALIAGLNPRAEQVRAEHGRLPVELLLERIRFDPAATLGAAGWIRALNQISALPAPATGRAVLRPSAAAAAPAYHENHYGLRSLVWRARAPFDSARLEAVLREGLPGVVRAKGFCWTSAQPDEMGFVSLAGGVLRRELLGPWWAAQIAAGRASLDALPASVRVHWAEPYGDRRQELVLIGRGLDEAALAAALEAALVAA
jgi:G3E family GTPase